ATRIAAARTSLTVSNAVGPVSALLSMNVSDLVRNCRGDPAASTALGVGRPGGTRTPNLRFWRPLLCQLSYWPRQSPRSSRSGSHSRPYFLSLRGASLDDLRHHAGADRSS